MVSSLATVIDETITDKQLATELKEECNEGPIAYAYMTIKSYIIDLCRDNERATNDSKIALSAINSVAKSDIAITEDLKTALLFINKYKEPTC